MQHGEITGANCEKKYARPPQFITEALKSERVQACYFPVRNTVYYIWNIETYTAFPATNKISCKLIPRTHAQQY